MKKVTAIIGSARKGGATYQAVEEFEHNLKRLGELEFEYVFLSDYQLEFCRGCKVCFDRGEEHCPLKDDRDVLLGKVADADGIVLATPNYTFQVSARMKNLLDRLAYIFHRPRFFGKTCTAIVTQGMFGGKEIAKYLLTMASNLGFGVAKGSSISTLEPMTENQQKKLKKEMKRAAKRFHKHLMRRTQYPAPSLFRLMMFRITRTGIRNLEDKQLRDYTYFQEKGWFESDYYYDTSLGPIKKTAGRFFDFLGHQIAKVM